MHYLEKLVRLPEAKENLRKHGNIWGPIDRFARSIIVFNRLMLKIEVRSKDNFMGRFGGGWNFKFGLQCSSLSHVLWFFGIGTFSWTWTNPNRTGGGDAKD